MYIYTYLHFAHGNVIFVSVNVSLYIDKLQVEFLKVGYRPLVSLHLEKIPSCRKSVNGVCELCVLSNLSFKLFVSILNLHQ